MMILVGPFHLEMFCDFKCFQTHKYLNGNGRWEAREVHKQQDSFIRDKRLKEDANNSL